MRLIHLAPPIIFFALTGYVMFEAFNDLSAGGNSWKQGDWLINNVETMIRRGMLGSALIESSRTLGISPVLLVVLVQSFLIVGSAVLIGLSLWRMVPRHTLWLLVISPGFFIRFWALDTQGGLRKETIAFFAFSLMLFAAVRAQSPRFFSYLATFIFSVSLIGHEGLVCLAPFFLVCLHVMMRGGQLLQADFLVMSALTAATALATIGIALVFRNAESYMAVCRPLLEMGVGDQMCEGAIKALEFPLSKYVETTFWMALSPRVFSFATLVVLNCGFMLIIGTHLVGFWTFVRPYLASTLLFLPLFVVALDWGRWVSLHTTASVFVLLVALRYEVPRTALEKEIPAPLFAGLLLFSLIWGFSHFLDVLWGGLVWSFLEVAGS